MGHPLIDEFCRIHTQESLRPDFFRRCQRVFRDEVQPQLDERDRLLDENATLKAQLEDVGITKAKRTKVEATA